ncbi:hypothetical protein BX616_005921 [Lobosporangium transversale]|nr:hypothetical protein BX616_005921 [Lobosporangium transversale]
MRTPKPQQVGESVVHQQQEQYRPSGTAAGIGARASATSPLLSHSQDNQNRHNGYSAITTANGNMTTTPHVNGGSKTQLVPALKQGVLLSRALSADSNATEDVKLLLQPKAHSDRDPRPESFVNHPTNSDIALILVALIQALGFMALVLVRWRFLEIGGHHGQPGHIHLPAYRFIMPVTQAFVWSYTFILCMLAAFTRHIVPPSRIRRMLIVFSMLTFVNAILRLRTTYRCLSTDEDPDNIRTPEQYQRVEVEFMLAIVNATLSTIFAYFIMTTSKGPDVYFEGRKVSPEINASFIRWITYDWMNELMWDGYDRALELFFQQQKQRPPSLLWRIYISNRRDIWINFIFGVISSIASFGMPYFLGQLLGYIEDKDNGVEETEPKERAYLYVFGMLISDIIKSVTFGQNLYYGRRVDIRLRSMLGAEVYAKSLRRKDMTGIISERTKKGARSDTGKITNLMAVDANRVASVGSSIFYLYTCPIEITIALVMLYRELELSSLVGLAVMFLTFPIHHFAAKKYAKIQEQLMETRDRRVGMMSELLQGIRMIKFFTWENNIHRKIMEVRDQELRRFVRLYIINTLFTLLWFGSPILVTVMAFTSYTKLEHKELTPRVAFTSMAIFILLRGPLNILPGMVTDLLEAKVSIKRIEAFLNEGEIWKYSDEALKEDKVIENQALSLMKMSNQNQTTGTIGFTNATFRWHTKASANSSDQQGAHSNSTSNSGAFMLKDLTIHFPIGKLSLVCGSTGSGKTSLLMALLREMDLISGSVDMPRSKSKIINPNTGYIPGTLAYVSQYPWLQQASIRENILFGSPLEIERYQHVLEACALLPDLAVFEHGDLTEIGEKGITLSGGQKQRVALARAMYSRAQHLLFDDCLSAVDAHTARHLFEHCLKGPLMNGRTRILVTHHVRLCLRDASYVVLLKEGSLALTGSPVKLIRSGLLSEILERNGWMEEDQGSSHLAKLTSEHGIIAKDIPFRAVPPKKKNTTEAKKLVDEEARSRGKVKLFVYNMYLKACGGPQFWFVLLFIFTVVKLLGIAEVLWIREWSTAYPASSDESIYKISAKMIGVLRWGQSDDGDEDSVDLDFYIGIYAMIVLMAVFLTIVRMFWQFYGSLRASRALYEELLVSIIRAPIRFFDTTPIGRIINRFSKDFEVIDGQMIYKMGSMLSDTLGIIVVILMISLVTPSFLITAFFIALAYFFVGAYYIASSRELKRIESVTKSPLYSHFGETLVGVSTIRAFGVESRFMEEVLVKLDNNNAPYYFLWMCNRWLNIRVDFMGAMVSFVAGILILLNLEHLDAGWAGLSLGSAMNFMGLVYWLVRIYTEMEMSLNSVERVNEYLEMPQEPPAIIEESRPPAGWPYDGKIEIKDLTMQYAPDMGPVLHNISISIRPREKIGIVGRTGSGKSTLALSLFRFMEPVAGSIVIDGIDISKIGLEDLRSRLTIIPQDAVLFNGTIRSNLDPFQEHTDYEIWEALRRVHLVKARGSRTGSRSSSPPGINAAFYQNHQNIPHPTSFTYIGHPFGMNDDVHAHLLGHPHQHHHDAPENVYMNPGITAPAPDFGGPIYNDPFHPALCPPTAPDRPAIVSIQGDYVEQQPRTSPGTTPQLLNGARMHFANANGHYDSNGGLLPIDPVSPRVLCSSLNQTDATDCVTAPTNGLLQGVVSMQDDADDPFEDLDSPVSDGGHNFSQGQRQLLCMARALLRQSRVIIMDEATASVDFATDEKIQTTIRNELGDSTLITVAHRLRTIMDYDRVLVLEQGHVVEFDSPINLITNPSSRFRDMVEKSGECDTLFEMAARAY